MEQVDYIYSQISSNSVAMMVEQQYDLPKLKKCKFYVLGLHDNYLIEDADNRYILRIYRNDWRSEQDIQFELELLSFLAKENVPVASPLPTCKGQLCFFIDSPEGKRVATLFNYADGYAPGNEITTTQCVLLGKTIAHVHQVADEYETSLSRQVLDVPYLLDASVEAIQTFIDKDSQNYLDTLKGKIKNSLPHLPRQEGVYGVCIGDVNPTNFHINGRKEITLFDFDQCGFGYRAFEIGKFMSSIHATKTKKELCNAFTEGYRQVRQLSSAEVTALPYYEIISVIWVMAIHAYNVDRIGYKYLEKPFWDRRFDMLRILEEEISK